MAGAPAPTFSPPDITVEPTPRWIRVRAGDTVVADSRRALLVNWFGPDKLPTYAIPADDVRTELLHEHAGPATGPDPFLVDFDVHVDGRVLERAAQLFRTPPAPLAELDGMWTFPWDQDVSWFEEAFEVTTHARDPHHRVDVIPSDRHIRIEIDGTVVADSKRPHALFETSLPTRWYLPLEDVRQELLVRTDTSSVCPYKGTASYWSVEVGDTLHEDIVWTYPDPIPEQPRIAGLVSFFNERVDVFVDGEREERPQTPWSE